MNEDSDGEVAIEIEDREVNLSLVDAIERLLKISPGQWEHDQFEGKKTLSKSLSVPNLKMGDFLVELEDHPDLRDKSPSGKRATIRRAIAKSGNISKVGERKASSYVMIPIDHIQDITLESKKSPISRPTFLIPRPIRLKKSFISYIPVQLNYDLFLIL